MFYFQYDFTNYLKLAVIQLLHVSLGSYKSFQSLAILLFHYKCFLVML